jgi:hypothetical protein
MRHADRPPGCACIRQNPNYDSPGGTEVIWLACISLALLGAATVLFLLDRPHGT